MVQTLPAAGPESRGGDRPDWDSVVAGEPLPGRADEISPPPDGDDEKAGQ